MAASASAKSKAAAVSALIKKTGLRADSATANRGYGVKIRAFDEGTSILISTGDGVDVETKFDMIVKALTAAGYQFEADNSQFGELRTEEATARIRITGKDKPVKKTRKVRVSFTMEVDEEQYAASFGPMHSSLPDEVRDHIAEMIMGSRFWSENCVPSGTFDSSSNVR